MIRASSMLTLETGLSCAKLVPCGFASEALQQNESLKMDLALTKWNPRKVLFTNASPSDAIRELPTG